MAKANEFNVRKLGVEDYLTTFSNMQQFVLNHLPEEKSEIWFVQHPPVYTQGTACASQTLVPSEIPIVKSDRGGQITYHGPGQVIMYVLLDIKRYDLTVKSLVTLLEEVSIMTLFDYGIEGVRREGAPGVYVDEKKVSALGLRFKRGMSYHGLSLNVDMDLQPFANIDPCGYKGLEVTQIKELLPNDKELIECADIEHKLEKSLRALLL